MRVLAPEGRGPGGDIGDADRARGIRAEVPARGKALAFLARQRLGQHQVAEQGVEGVLPGPERIGHAQRRRLAGGEGGEQIGQQAMRAPVAAADDVAGAGRGKARGVRRGKVGLAPGTDRDFGAALAGTVGIMPPHGRVFGERGPVRRRRIAFVAGDDDGGLHRGAVAHGVEQVQRAVQVGGVGVARRAVALGHGGLRRQVEYHAGLALIQGGRQRGEVADVALSRIQVFGNLRKIEKIGLRRRLERIRRDPGADSLQPEGKPGALEAGMAGQEDAAPAPESGVEHQRHPSLRLVMSGLLVIWQISNWMGCPGRFRRRVDASMISARCRNGGMLQTTDESYQSAQMALPAGTINNPLIPK
jgi:hypothetical protein